MLWLSISHDLLPQPDMDVPAQSAPLADGDGQLLGLNNPSIFSTPGCCLSGSGPVHLPVRGPHDDLSQPGAGGQYGQVLLSQDGLHALSQSPPGYYDSLRSLLWAQTIQFLAIQLVADLKLAEQDHDLLGSF